MQLLIACFENMFYYNDNVHLITKRHNIANEEILCFTSFNGLNCIQIPLCLFSKKIEKYTILYCKVKESIKIELKVILRNQVKLFDIALVI